MAAAVMVLNEKMDMISTVARDYYDSDNAFNFYRQVPQNQLTTLFYHYVGYCCMAMVVVMMMVMLMLTVFDVVALSYPTPVEETIFMARLKLLFLCSTCPTQFSVLRKVLSCHRVECVSIILLLRSYSI